MSQLAASRIPVIVAIGECTERPEDLLSAREPVALMAAALREAEGDAGVPLLSSLTSVELIGQVTWPYSNPVELLCNRLEISPPRKTNESFGGDTPARLMHNAAGKIAGGEAVVAAIVGGEAVSSLRKAGKAKADLPWTPRASKSERVKVDFEELEMGSGARRIGLNDPTDVYPLFENAYLHRAGQSPAQGMDEAARIWADYAQVAAGNPFAWNTSAPTADDIREPSPRNRMIAFPYPKFMVANPMVNQAAALVVTSLEQARRMGVKEDNPVYIQGGAAAREPADFLERDGYDVCAAQEAVLEAVVEIAGHADVFDLLELYSCFPVVPKLACEVLGRLGLRDGVAPTVAGGLTFFGGPINNYMSHAACAMVRKLRSGEGETGLLYAQGGVMTKHHAVVLSKTAPARALAEEYSVQGVADAKRGAIPDIPDSYTGPAEIETYTIKYGAMGPPLFGVVVARTPEGGRVIARVRVDDEASMRLLSSMESSPIGTQGHMRVDAFGQSVWEAGEKRDRRTRRPKFCRVEREGNLTIVTINRPDVMNALQPLANEELSDIFDDFQADPDQWVAILTGAGDKAFSAGNDLGYTAKAMQNGEPVIPPVKGFAGLTSRWDLNKPVIAAVNGVAMGGGFEIALACDLIIASNQAVFALPEPKVGLAALAGGLHRLPRQIGEKQAMGMILTGRGVGAEEGLALGFVNEVVAPEELIKAARRWADDIMACSPMSVRASKQIAMRGLADASLGKAFERQGDNEALQALYRSDDIREGPRAFAEKRPPQWRGF